MKTFGQSVYLKSALALIFIGSSLNAATYYVATTGSDSNPGTLAAPFQTIQRGVNAAAAGDTVIVRDGTYTPPASAGCSGGNGFAVTINTSGSSSAWITLKSENKLGATIDAANSCHSAIMFGGGAGYVKVQGFRIVNAMWGGVWNNSGASNITLKGNEIANIGRRVDNTQYGIVGSYAGATSTNLVFDGNYFHDIGRTASTYTMNNDHGLYLHCQNTTIINNTFAQPISGWGVQTASSFSGLIANNTFFGPQVADKPGQIVLWDAAGSVTIRNNIFHTPKYAAIGNAGFSSSSCSIDNNIVYGSGVTMTDSSVPCTMTNNRLNTDPMLTNVSTRPYDFHLKNGSPAIDNAVTVSQVTTDQDGLNRPQGAGPDVGAFEYNSAPVVQPPVISSVATSNVTYNSATITWVTDKLSDSLVNYGIGNVNTSAPLNSNQVTNHSVTLTGLTPSSTYSYQVVSKDTNGLTTQSSLYTLTTPAAPVQFNFSASASPSTLTVQQGGTGSATVTGTLQSGAAQSVSFSAAGLPAGVTASFSQTSCSVTCSVGLTLNVASSAAAGTFPIQVNAAGGGVQSATTVSLTVSSQPSQPSQPVNTSGLAGYWLLTDGSGASTKDSSGNNNTGTFYSTPTWVKTGKTTVLSFSGYGDHVEVKESSSIELSSQMTVAFWVSPQNQNSVDERIIAKSYSWDVKLNGNQRYPQLSAAGKYAQMAYSLPPNAWTHVVFTFSNGTVKGYINGSPVSMQANTFTNGTTLPAMNYGLMLGTDASNSAPMKGLLSIVRLYGKQLADSDIQSIYQAEKPLH